MFQRCLRYATIWIPHAARPVKMPTELNRETADEIRA
jgi:hypothetical protein